MSDTPIVTAQVSGSSAIVPSRSMDSSLADSLERKRLSRQWLRENYWDEFEESFRFFSARTKQLIDEKTGKEDKTRTNVSMPDYWIIGRRKTAKLAARAPTIHIRSDDPHISDWLSAYCAYQWDHAGEQKIQRRHVLQSQIFGLSVKHHWYDKIQFTRRFRRSTEEMLKQRGAVMDDEAGQLRMADEGEDGRPIDDFNQTDRADLTARMGPEQLSPTRILKFEGPVSSFVFIGDLYPEPEFSSIHEAAWVTIDKIVDTQWLLYYVQQEYEDPQTGEKRPAIDKNAVAEMVDSGPWARGPHDRQDEDFSQRLRAAIYKTYPVVRADLIPGKRYLISMEHTFRDGWCWVRFIGNEKFMLGEIPLPWDLYGHYPISALTPIPGLLHGIGDSSMRVLRHLMRLNNIAAAQRTDLITNSLKPLVLMREGADIPTELMDRGAFRVVFVKNMGDFQYAPKPDFPAEAWEHGKDIQMRLQQGEPVLIDFGTQSQAEPNSQQVATLGVLQARAGESLSSDELEQLNESIAEETNIKLWMLQQALNDDIELPGKYFKDSSYSAMTPGAGENMRSTRLGPLDFQTEFEVEPEMYSTLALDDTDKRNDAMTIYQLAMANPAVWNIYTAAKDLAGTFRGRSNEDLVNPPPPPTPPTPPIKLGANLAIKLDLAPAVQEAVQQAIMELLGIPVDQTHSALDHMNTTLGGITQLADHVSTLAGEPMDKTPEVSQPAKPIKPPSGNGTGAKK